jgi:hypothetical protein
MKTPTFRLGDDGTLDTVIICNSCGEELRYTFDPDASEPDGEQAYDDFVTWALEDAADQHDCETPADEPQEDDLTTTDHEKFYQSGDLVLYHASNGEWYWYPKGARHSTSVHLGAFHDDHVAALKAYMQQAQYWPDCWFVSDHGNAHRIEL